MAKQESSTPNPSDPRPADPNNPRPGQPYDPNNPNDPNTPRPQGEEMNDAARRVLDEQNRQTRTDTESHPRP